MADSTKNSSELIDEIISFIEKERELYGDFSIKESPSEVSSKPEGEETVSGSDKVQDAVKDIYRPEQIYDEVQTCTTLEELESICQKADMLKTDLKNTKLIFGDGNPHADLMLIGEAPGAEEDKIGEPFVGRAGQLLNKILKAINFDRDEIYITNILKHRPPNNRNPLPEESKRSLPFLLKQIELIRPKLILALGKVSAQTLLESDASLTSMRGKFHPFGNDIELLVTYHPAALLRRKQWKRPTWEDVQMLRKRYDERVEN